MAKTKDMTGITDPFDNTPNVFVRNPYNYDMDAESKRTGLLCQDKSLTQQSFAEEADINTIVERFHLTGQLPQLDKLPEYGDYEGIFDFQTAMNTIAQARENFMQLPANLRARFDNDPQKFLAFAADRDNLDEAKKLGILSDEAVARLDAAAAKAEDERAAARAATRSAKQDNRASDPTAAPAGNPEGGGKGNPTGKK